MYRYICINGSSFTDVFKTGVWQQMFCTSAKDPELARLAKNVEATVLSSRAAATTKKYTYAYLRWKDWATAKKLVHFPVNEVNLSLYLQHIGETSGSKAAVEAAVHSIAWAHELAGIPPPSDSPLVQATLKGLQRQLSKPVTKKQPITVEMLQDIVASLGPKPTLAEIRLAAAALLAFSAFLRYDELARLRCCDIVFQVDCMLVHISSSKTDKFREGACIPVARTWSHTCPVAMIQRYMEAAQLEPQATGKLFRGIIVTNAGARLRKTGSLSYTRLRELLLEKLNELGYDKSQFSLHSLRAGGASCAANAGVQDRLFKRHGRWLSDTAKDGYVKDSRDRMLSVTKKLGL